MAHLETVWCCVLYDQRSCAPSSLRQPRCSPSMLFLQLLCRHFFPISSPVPLLSQSLPSNRMNIFILTNKKRVISLKFSTGGSLAGLIMGTTRTTDASPEAGYCYKLSLQSTMYSFDGRFRWLITLVWMQTHWMIMLVMNRECAGTCTFSATRQHMAWDFRWPWFEAACLPCIISTC